MKYPEPMTAEQVTNAFNEVGHDSKLWQALDSVIDNHLLDAVNEVANPELDSNQTSHAAGRIDAISQLKSRIEEYRKWKNGKTNYNKK